MHHIVIAYCHIERCAQQQFQFLYSWWLFFGCYTVTDDSNVLIGKTGKAFALNFESYPGWTLPAYRSRQDTILHVERTLVRKDSPSSHVETLTIDKQFDREPVRSIGQFLFPYANIIENAREQGSRGGAKIVLLECTSCGKVAIANGVDTFLTAYLFGLKVLFADLP